MIEWAPLLRDAVTGWYTDSVGLDPVVGRIGNPNVGGQFPLECAGVEVHVDFGSDGGPGVLYRTVEPWPTQRQDVERYTKTDKSKVAAEFQVRVLMCVPQRKEDGGLPTQAEHDASVAAIGVLGQGLFDALVAAQLLWRGNGTGYVHLDPIVPIEREGLHAGFECRVVCEVC